MIGIDIVKISRIEKLLENPRFLNRVFTKREIDYFKSINYRAESIAGSFSAKEAVSKLLGTGIGRIGFKDIIIEHDYRGKPICLFGDKIKSEMKEIQIDISISHEIDYAIAVAYSPSINGIRNIDNSGLPILKKRERESHKGDYGRISLIGGSRGMSGSILLSSKAALRMGSGIVYTVVPSGISESVEMRSLENIVLPVEDSGKDFFNRKSIDELRQIVLKSDASCFGPGVGSDDEIYDVLKAIIEIDKALVIDADGLNCLRGRTDILKNTKTVITPHRMEMARLADKDIKYVNRNPINLAMSFSKLYNIIVVLKGHNTIVTDGNEVYSNSTGNPGMATAGSGDVLTGMITSLLGQGYDLFDSAKLGVFLHGLSGDIAAEILCEESIIASDIIRFIPHAVREKRLLDGRGSYISDMGGDKS
ncbi:MAG: NAD(P)H-hydrate dehydratase [Tissierellia bacterium]|nr:NAD(P)H-hydrate dehydratase [Tissierellia bacterium]